MRTIFFERDDYSNRKILLIDDEKDILYLLETVLRKEGFKYIIKATNGEESIRLCQEENQTISY